MFLKNKALATIGILLLSLYLAQLFIEPWAWLEEKQQDEMFKRWTGLGLFVFILFQWILTLSRLVKKFDKFSLWLKQFHNQLGAISPLFLYLHSMKLGYGYLMILSSIFLSNMLIGTINLDVIKSSNKWVFNSWMIVHVGFSIGISLLMLYHIGVVFYYK